MSASQSKSENAGPGQRFRFSQLGPAIIIAAVVCGPGSILASSKVGAEFGYAAAWLAVLVCALLARAKGWTEADRRAGMIDSLIGIGALAAISLIIMFTSAAAFHGRQEVPTLESLQDVAEQLRPLFGVWAQVVFAIGLILGGCGLLLSLALAMRVVLLMSGILE